MTLDKFIFEFLNIFFFLFHTLFTLFNLVGWMFKKTRKLHLITMLLTGASWFLLGIWYGWGYCFCTDWHWQVREHLGYHDMPRSYISFLIFKLTGASLNEALVENVTAIVFIFCFLMSLLLNIKDWKKTRMRPRSPSHHNHKFY